MGTRTWEAITRGADLAGQHTDKFMPTIFKIQDHERYLRLLLWLMYVQNGFRDKFQKNYKIF